MSPSEAKKYKIAVLSGDGIGPEVCAEAVKVIKAVGSLFQHNFVFEEALCGGAAFDKYKKHLPQETLDVVAKSDAVLFGSVGGPTDAQEDPKVCHIEVFYSLSSS
jgi:3-isopropylmalate dehydrogenase